MLYELGMCQRLSLTRKNHRCRCRSGKWNDGCRTTDEHGPSSHELRPCWPDGHGLRILGHGCYGQLAHAWWRNGGACRILWPPCFCGIVLFFCVVGLRLACVVIRSCNVVRDVDGIGLSLSCLGTCSLQVVCYVLIAAVLRISPL